MDVQNNNQEQRYTMQHEILGGNLPVAIMYPQFGQTLYSQGGAMSWMSPNMDMSTNSGGLGRGLSRMFAGESFFLNYYTSKNGPGTIAMSSKFPGTIRALELDGSRSYILQKQSFLAATDGIRQDVILQRNIGSGLFGGEGFVLQKLSGVGTLFIEIDGFAWETTLAPGQEIVVSSGYLAYMDDTCTLDIQQVPGWKNKFFGGEGWFNTVIKGPGKVVLQTHPLSSMAALFYTGD